MSTCSTTRPSRSHFHELDTVRDFTNYLTWKEAFIRSGKFVVAPGEEDMLAYYLTHTDASGEHAFVLPKGATHIGISEGTWTTFLASAQRRARVDADEVSYAWDALIEEFVGHLLGGTQYFATTGVRDQEKAFRLMARESRTRRRMLAGSLIDLMQKSSAENGGARVAAPTRPGEPHYVFLVFPRRGKTEAECRELRRTALASYCMAAKALCPDAQDIVGIATDAGMGTSRSEDLSYLDGRQWSAEAQAEAERLHLEVGLLKNVRRFAVVDQEYPSTSPSPTPKHRIPGSARNTPCSCGSCRKYKRCCGT